MQDATGMELSEKSFAKDQNGLIFKVEQEIYREDWIHAKWFTTKEA